ncbi:MAG: hypothetical protein NC924_05350 [Candidatus Omnitrophica bacterium]|nr:hypothetical protein [Candidatus Omnitrophota bacterium]
MEDIFEPDLLKDEQILWSGQPDPAVWFMPADLFLIPFSCLWGGFAIFWESLVLRRDSSGQQAPLYFILFGIPFVAMGLFMMVGRFFWKRYVKQRTYYAVTDKRVLVLTVVRGRALKAEYIKRISQVQKSVRADGKGMLRFGNPAPQQAFYGNTGLDFFGDFYGPAVPVFYDIADVHAVYTLVNDLRNEAQPG